MRTGKNRQFAKDDDAAQTSQDLATKGKGLVGGDIERIPHLRRGLTPYIDFPLHQPVEIRRFPESEEEKQEAAAFLAHRPLEIEVGFGGGQSLVNRALNHPDVHCVGFEIRRGLCLPVAQQINERRIANLRVIYEDVRQALEALFDDHSLRRCSVFFPDPWWKKRHIKRRVLTPFFLDLMAKKLVPQGMLHVKTDVMPYADVIQELLDSDSRYTPDDGTHDSLFEGDHPTEREEFCLERGLPFAEFRYVLTAPSE